MLKAQLKSKISQLDSEWMKNEDILTGDFFGVLDYLPRNPYLYRFISYIVSLNPDVHTPSTDGVDWDSTEIKFWPRTSADDENAEPDIVMLSNKWIVVVEVKLQSDFGDTQPWREYVVGQKIAKERSIPADSVYYLVLARKRLDIAPTFKSDEIESLRELRARTNYLKWHEAVALIESWLRADSAEYVLAPEHERMLTDLFKAMRKRRAIAFSGFTFANMALTTIPASSVFCPPWFTGFQCQAPETQPAADTVFLGSRHAGFVVSCPEVGFLERPVFLPEQFGGFIRNSQILAQTCDDVFFTWQFTGFLHTAPACDKYLRTFKKGLNK